MRPNLAIDTHKNVVSNVEKFLKENLDIKVKNREMKVLSIQMPESFEDSFKAQKNAKINGLSYADPIKATISLKENGKEIDRATVKVLDLPRVTSRGTYIVGGNEYSFPMQKRLIPGVYVKEHNDGTISAWLNSSKGRNMTIRLRSGGDFVLEIDNNNVNLYAFLIAMGMPPEKLKRIWGDDVWDTNRAARGATDYLGALKKAYSKLHYSGDPGVNGEEIAHYRDWINKYFYEKSEFDSSNVEISLGQKHDKISIELILQATQKILDVSKGDKEEDNRESLIHNHIYDLSDFIVERMGQRQYMSRIKRTLERNIQNYDKVSQIIQKDIFQNPVESTFTQTNLSRMPKQTNPMDQMSSYTELTMMGEGGIMSTHAVTRDVRAIDPSHIGFIDPAHTPEGSNVGTTLHITTGAKKRGKDLVNTFYDVKNKKTVELTPRELYTSVVCFPESYQNNKLKPDEDGYIKVTHEGKIKKVKPNEVQYAFMRSTDFFDVNTLAIPFLSHNNGTRVMTGSKMQSQAKPLKYREVPLIQSAISESSDETIEQIMGRGSVPVSPVSGTVKKVSKDEVVINDGATDHKVELPHNFWMNENNYTDAEAVVKVGDKVKKGQPLADTNYTKDGVLALGTNLRVAYIPYKGYNHEDGVVISETCAKRLTSLHAYQNVVPIQQNETTKKEKFLAYFPALFTQEQLSNIDDDGVVKKGVKLKKGDPIVLKMKKVEEDTASKQIQNISRLLASDFRDTSYLWDKSVEGEVDEIHIRPKEVMVVVKTEEPAVVGDKLVGRYGNKGTITTILPDNEMPKNEKNEVLDILMDPTGTPGRMNIGQIMETTASHLAEKDGKPYIAKPFSGKHTESILKDLKKKGLKDHGSITDKDGQIDGVLAGKQYFFKLEHQVDKKLSARGAGPDYVYSLSGQPGRGDHESGRAVGLGELYSLLSHGANANIAEMYTFKGDRQFESWRAIENGSFLPPPEVPASSTRFVGMLKGMGVNLVESKNMVKMTPFLDKDVRKISNGAIKDATTLRAKDLKEENGGLFDLKTTGGVVGDKWAHIELSEPMPHPTFEKAIISVTGLTTKEFEEIMSGKKGVLKGEVVPGNTKGAQVGGLAIKSLLKKVDVDSRIKEISEISKTKKGTELNKLNQEARTLINFRDNDIKLEEMVVETIPVVPPKFRPIVELPNGDINVSDANEHYRATILMNQQMDAYKGRPGLVDEANKARKNLYEGVKGTMGFSKGLVDKPDVKGFASAIAGTNPKSGFYHSKLIKRRQETSGTAVVGPEPNLNMDQIGVPENMAWDIFKPHVVRELRQKGLTPLKAKDEIENKTPLAREALLATMEKRHVIANRAPTLHRWSMMAFKPQLVSGSAIKLPVEVLSAYNADFDGDCTFSFVFQGNKHDGFSTIHIKDFRRVESTKKHIKENVIEFDVPKGTQVFAYDKENHRIKPYDVTKFSIHSDLSMRKVTHRSNRSVDVSDDHSLFCFDPEKIDFVRSKPDDSIGLFTPRPKVLDMPPPKDEWCFLSHEFSNPRSTELSKTFKLDEKSGYFWGAMVGDGWASKKGHNSYTVGFSSVTDEITEKIREFIISVGGKDGSMHENPHEFDGHECFSKKAHWGFSDLGYNIQQFIGSGAANKHLPPFWVFGNEDHRLAMLAGLLDTDGSINIANAKAKNKPQIQCNYTTKSEILSEEVGLLCASLGIRSNKTKYSRNGEDYYCVTISTVDLKDYAKTLPVVHPNKKSALLELSNTDIRNRQDDVVPIHPDLLVRMRSNLGASKTDKKVSSSYSILSKSIKKKCILRDTILDLIGTDIWEKMVSKLEGVEDKFHSFMTLLYADNILWDEVVKVEDLGDGHEAYDITVPDSLVFMVSNGLIIYDTFGIHVPATEEANREAEKMLTSNNLYRPGNMRDKMSPELSKEYMMGIYKLTRNGRTTSKNYQFIDYALRDAQQKKIKWDDIISIRRIGRTTAGKIRAMQKVPNDMKNYQITLDAKAQEKFLIAIEKKHGKKAYMDVIEDWKHAGRIHVYQDGSSLLLSDMQSLSKERNQLYRKADMDAARIRANKSMSEEEKEAKIIDIYSKVDSKIIGMAVKLPNNAAGKSNNISDMVNGGLSKPGPNQLKQMVGHLGLMMDHQNKIMPEPIRGNYSEGLSSSEFFQHMYAQRKGMIDKSQEVSGPGMLSKELTNSATTQKVTMVDCGTKNGRLDNVDRHLLDRITAEAVAGVPSGTIVDQDVLGKLQKSGKPKIKMRSILTCEAPQGICAKCFGLDEHGSLPYIGKNIGVSEIQAITERSVQLPMKSFHTGGVASADKGTANAFDRALQILRMPDNIKNKATLAERSGQIMNIKKSGYGGFIVNINGMDHKVPKGLNLKVKEGQMVQKGDAISDGLVKPQELLKLRGIDAVQDQMRSDLNDAFSSAGVKLHTRTYEVPVKMLTENVRITDPGDSPDFIAGDRTTKPKVEAWNRANIGKRPIRYTHELAGSLYAPLQSDDWARRMALNRISGTLQEGAALGYTSDRKGVSPFADIVLGPGTRLPNK